MESSHAGRFRFSRIIELLWLAVIFVIPLFFNPIGRSHFYVHKTLLLQFLVIAMVAFFIADLIMGGFGEQKRRLKGIITSPLYLSMLVFGFIAILAAAISITPAISFWGSYFRKQGLLTLLCWVSFFLMVTIYMRSRQQVIRAVYTLLMSSGIVSVFGIALHFIPEMSEKFLLIFSSRVFSTTGNALSLSAFLAMIIPLNLALMIWLWRIRREGRNYWKLGGLVVLLLLQLWCLWLAQYSITILLYIVPIFVFLLVLGIIKRRKVTLVFGAVPLLILAVLAVLILVPLVLPSRGIDVPEIQSISSDISAESLGLKTLDYRVQYWRSTIDVIFKSPEVPFYSDKLHMLRTFIGYGPETFLVTFQQVFPENSLDHSLLFEPLTRPHNHYLYLAATVGLLGLIAFLALLAAFFSLCARCLRKAKSEFGKLLLIASIAGMAGYMVDILFNPSTISAELVFWVILSIATVMGTLIVGETKGDGVMEETARAVEIDKSGAGRARWYISVVCAVFLISIGGFITAKPLLADMKLQRGLSYYNSPYATEVYISLKKAAELMPGEAVYWAYLGEYGYHLARQVNDEQTRETFLKFSTSSYEEARRLEPYVAYRYHLPADVYTYWANNGAEDKWTTALSLYEKAWTLSPHDPLILDKWALALVVKGDLNEAREKLALAESVDSTWFGNELIYVLGVVDTSESDRAIATLVTSIKKNTSDFARYFDRLCFILAHYDMVKPLDMALNSYVQKMPDEWISHAMLGATSLFVGDLEKSVDEFKVATSLATRDDARHLSSLISNLSARSPSLKARLPDIFSK